MSVRKRRTKRRKEKQLVRHHIGKISATSVKRYDRRLLKFLIVGVLNTTVGYSIFFVSLFFGLHYSVAIAIATVLGILFNFKTTGILVFQERDKSRLTNFIAVYCVVYTMNVAGVGMLLKIRVPEWLGALVLILPLAFLSYFLNSRYVFKK